MNVQTITYTKRHNEGNYQHSEYQAQAVLADGESALLAFLELKKLIHDAIEIKAEEIKAVIHTGAASSPEDVTCSEEPTPVVEEVKEKKTRKPRTAKVEEPKVESEPELEVGSMKVPHTSAPVETAVVKYDRTVEAHKQLLSSFLTNNFSSWKTKVGVKEFSGSLVGKPFLDVDGSICSSFKTALYDFFA